MKAGAIEPASGVPIGYRDVVLTVAVTVGLACGISALFGRHSLVDVLTQGKPWTVQLAWGVGEELLFRGALQPLAGLWLTSLLFTVVHYQTGQFRTMDRWKALYALLVFLVSLGLGILCIQIGLIAAIVTHTVVDIVGLTGLRNAPVESAEG